MGLTQREVKEGQAKGLVNDFTVFGQYQHFGKSLNEMSLLFNALNFAIAFRLC